MVSSQPQKKVICVFCLSIYCLGARFIQNSKQNILKGYPAIREETLIDKSKLADRELFLRKTNDAIAKWLDRRYEDLAKNMKTLKRNTGQMSIFHFFLPAENRR